MTSRELVIQAIERKPVPRLPFCDALWDETARRWREEGHIGMKEEIDEHFHYDIISRATA